MASTVTELLRRRFGGKKEVDPFENWLSWYVFVSSNNVSRNICSDASVFDRMLMDGVEITPTRSKTFTSSGTYFIQALLKSNVTSLPAGFLNAAHYRRCTLPSLITAIGSNAFHNFASNIDTWLVCKATTPPTLIGDPFYNSARITIYVPDASLTAYQTAWASSSSVGKLKALSEKP